MVPLVIQWLMLGVLAQPYRDAMVNVSPGSLVLLRQ